MLLARGQGLGAERWTPWQKAGCSITIIFSVPFLMIVINCNHNSFIIIIVVIVIYNHSISHRKTLDSNKKKQKTSNNSYYKNSHPINNHNSTLRPNIGHVFGGRHHSSSGSVANG